MKTYAEVLHGDCKRVEDFSVDRIIFQIDELHLLTNLLEGSLGAEGSQISSDVSVTLVGNLNRRNS